MEEPTWVRTTMLPIRLLGLALLVGGFSGQTYGYVNDDELVRVWGGGVMVLGLVLAVVVNWRDGIARKRAGDGEA